MKTKINSIVFIGSGNVATRLAIALKEVGKKIVQIYSRSEENASDLGNKLGVDFTTNLSSINSEADLYILSVSDNALDEIIQKLDLHKKLIVHTSGTTSMDVLNSFDNYGVFYPLQTFSSEKEISFKNIPLCIEANSDDNFNALKDLAETISGTIHHINSEQRKHLHVSAVFANNFTNYMYTIAEDILQDNDLPFDLLKPLIQETAAKILTHTPSESQTGPARRNDQEIINTHLDLLNKYPEYQKIYQLLSEQIKRKHQ